MKMPWTITVTGVTADQSEVGSAVFAIAALLNERGDGGVTVAAQPLAVELAAPLQRSKRRKRTSFGACSECGAQAGLHALSCQHYSAEPEHLSDACLAELRSLPPSQWHGWPPDDYDQGLPWSRYGRTTSRRYSPKSIQGGRESDPVTSGRN
jgi:hypothetical protein